MSQHQPTVSHARSFAQVAAAIVVTVGSLGIGSPATRGDIVIDLGRGPVTVHVPPSYDPAVSTPLILLLHGYSGNGPQQEAYMQFTPLSDQLGFLYAYPNGTRDANGYRFWNATDACCDFYSNGVDDSGYLRDLIDAVKAQANVDDRRVHLIGHSNGGFMSYRMACDHADVIASIASLAGATFLDPNDCLPVAPVHVLQIHGTADATVLYAGGCFSGSYCYPGAVETVERWAAYDGCALVGEPGAALNLDASLPGAETQVTSYASGCARGGSAELWTIVGGSHVPSLSNDFSGLVIDFLYAHPKPGPLGDLDGDCDVDLADLAQLLGNYGATSGMAYEDGDLDADGDVDLSDLAGLLAVYGTTCP